MHIHERVWVYECMSIFLAFKDIHILYDTVYLHISSSLDGLAEKIYIFFNFPGAAITEVNASHLAIIHFLNIPHAYMAFLERGTVTQPSESSVPLHSLRLLFLLLPSFFPFPPLYAKRHSS